MAELYTPSPAPSPERKLPIVPILIGAGLGLLALLIAGGLLVYSLATRRPNAIPQLLPADTQLYVAFTPNLNDVPNLERLRRAFPTPDDAPVDDSFNQQLEQQLGVRFEADIAPWIGAEAAFAVSNIPFANLAGAADLADIDLPSATDAAVILASRDDRAAQAFLDKQRAHREGQGQQFTSSTAGGVTISSQEGGEQTPLAAFAIVRGHVVFATSADLIAAMAERDPNGEGTLERNPRFQEVRAALPESRLAYLFLDSAPLVEAVETSLSTLEETAPELQPRLDEQMAAVRALNGMGLSLAAEPDGFAVDAVASVNRAQLPADTLRELDEYRTPVDAERLAGISERTLAAVSFRIPPSFGANMLESLNSVGATREQVTAFEEQLDFDLERDLFSWLHGEATLVLLPGEAVMGEDLPVTGYFALRPEDLEAAQVGIEKLVGVLEQTAGGDLGLREEQLGGASWQVFGPPDAAVGGYAFVGEELAIGVGPGALAAAAGADARLDGEAAFKTAIRALPAPNSGAFYLSLAPILDLAEEQGADPEQLDGLRAFQAIAAAGSPGVDDKGIAHSRLFISVATTP